jgi:O-phospho-L-seryl-tRNASec:L-selenocysteinyl-tRNA synthase
MEKNLADLYVSSTDKNFMVPVGGSIVYSQNKILIEKLENLYPGRCSINVVLDMFVTLLSMGKK